MNTNLKAATSAKLRTFVQDQSGQTAMIFALSVLPALAAVGGAVDYANGIMTKSSLQAAVDSAVLGAQYQSITTNSALQTYVQSQIPLGNTTVTSATYNSGDTSMCATVTRSVPTVMMNIVGVNNITAHASACSVNASAGSATYEIALALDNTGSMSTSDSVTHHTKIASEITAANNFVSQVFTAAGTTNAQISVVPFTTAVKVDTSYATQSWMDKQGQSSIHWENFPKLGTAGSAYQQTAEATIHSRFDLFTQVNQSWGGCVEERPLPYTLTDDAPDSATPDTLFVPMFAPDEADKANSTYKSYNSYISDNGGTCSSGDTYATVDAGTASGSITATYKDGTSFWGDGQQKFCKYLIKYTAANPSTVAQNSALQSTISSWFDSHNSNNVNVNVTNCGYNNYYCNYYNYYNPSSSTIANLISSNSNLYSVNTSANTVTFCRNFTVNYNASTQVYSLPNNASCQSNDNNNGFRTATLPANYTPVAPSGSATVSTGYANSSSLAGWAGSGWGSTGWGTGGGWGWGQSTVSGSTKGFNPSTTNPGVNAAGQSSNLHIGSNQFNLGGGANSGCDTTLKPLQTLTSTQSTLTTLINGMQADGATNLVSGMMWAWRTISPNGPFTSGGSPRAYNTAGNHKIIVFMTDGYNNWEPDDSQNRGVYSALGYYHNKRAGALTVNGTSQTPTATNNRAYLDAAFLQACTNAKNAGVEIYTVAFSITNAPIDQQGRTVLQSCATDTNHYMAATDGTSLNSYFSAIGHSILQKTVRLKS